MGESGILRAFDAEVGGVAGEGCLDVDNGMFKGSHGLVDDK